MAIGPVEYIIVGFPGSKFNGEIAPALGKLVESGTIRILDLVFITKDVDGNVEAIEFEDHDDVALSTPSRARSAGSSAKRTSPTLPTSSSRTHRRR